MSLNCFFGLELTPDDVAVSPVIPAKSKLVITHCSITAVHSRSSAPAASSSALSSSSTPNHTPSTSSPGRLLDGAVTLYVQGHGIPKPFAVCTLSLLQGVTYAPLELLFQQEVHFTLRKSSTGACGPDVLFPSVHLTGYYEEDDDASEVESTEEDSEREGESSDGEERGGRRHPHPSSGEGMPKKRPRKH